MSVLPTEPLTTAERERGAVYQLNHGGSGCGSNDTAHSVQMTREAKALGAAGILAVIVGLFVSGLNPTEPTVGQPTPTPLPGAFRTRWPAGWGCGGSAR